MATETEMIGLRVAPETRALLQRTADNRGLSLAALLRQIAEDSVGTSSHLDRWSLEVERALDALAFIRDTEGLATLVPKLEDKVLNLEGELEELLEAIEQERDEDVEDEYDEENEE